MIVLDNIAAKLLLGWSSGEPPHKRKCPVGEPLCDTGRAGFGGLGPAAS